MAKGNALVGSSCHGYVGLTRVSLSNLSAKHLLDSVLGVSTV